MTSQHSIPTPRTEKKMLFLGSSFQGCLIFSEELNVSSHFKNFTAHLCIIACFTGFLGHHNFFPKTLTWENKFKVLIVLPPQLHTIAAYPTSLHCMFIRCAFVGSCCLKKCSETRKCNIWSSFSSFNSLSRQYVLVMKYSASILQASLCKYLGLLWCCDKAMVTSVSCIKNG